jgi:hypothetical protein
MNPDYVPKKLTALMIVYYFGDIFLDLVIVMVSPFWRIIFS